MCQNPVKFAKVQCNGRDATIAANALPSKGQCHNATNLAVLFILLFYFQVSLD